MADRLGPQNAGGMRLMPDSKDGKLGENLAKSVIYGLPQLPTDNPEEYRLQQLQYAMHLETSMLNYTPEAGILKNLDPQQASRFEDSKAANKRRIYVNKEVLGRLVTVAEELNRAQAQIEVRKLLKREHKRMAAEAEEAEEPDPATVADVVAGMEMDGGDDPENPSENGPKLRANQKAKRMQSMRVVAQVRYPAILSATAPKDRWGYFKAMQRLLPGANTGRPGHIAFGSTAPSPNGAAQQRQRPRVGGAAAVKAAKALIQDVERQAADPLATEASSATVAAAAPAEADVSAALQLQTGDSGRLPDLQTTVQVVMQAHEIREARRAMARQLAEDEGLPCETWWDIMQKRKKVVYFKKLLEEMSGRMDILRLHRAAKIIQKAWRVHHRARTRNASEEIALLQRELAHRKAMEVALRAAAEAALRDQQERARKRALRLAAKLSVPAPTQGDTRQSPKGGRLANNTFSRATSSKTLGWQLSLRGSLAPSRSVSRSVSRAVSRSASRAASARQRQPAAGDGEGGEEGAYQANQHTLWNKIQALIGTDWDVDGEEDELTSDSSSSSSDEEEEAEDDEAEEDMDPPPANDVERERRRHERREQLALKRAARKAVAAAAASEKKAQKQRRKPPHPEGQGQGMFPLSKATILARVVKQAVAAAKAMHVAEEKKAKKRKKAAAKRRKKADPASTMRMLAAAASALNMTVEAYIAMRNRKLGITALQPWQPPPQPLVVQVDTTAVAIDEDELREMEEEARHELLEKAALNFVANAAAAVASAADPSRQSSTSGGDAAAASSDPAAAATWGASAAAALAGENSTTSPAVPPLLLTPGMSAEEAAAAFAAAAAPSLAIQEDDVWALVKEKLRARMAARAAEEAAAGGSGLEVSGLSGVLRLKSKEELQAEAAAAAEESSSNDDSSDDDEANKKKEAARRKAEEAEAARRRDRSGGGGAEGDLAGAAAAASPTRIVTPTPADGDQADGDADAAAADGEGDGEADSSEYDTMSEEEIKHAGPRTLRKIQKQKDKARRKLQGYYSRRILAKKAAAAAAAEALRAERAAARAERRDTLAQLRKPVGGGPAWRPGGATNKKNSAAWSSQAAAAAATAEGRQQTSERGGGAVQLLRRRQRLLPQLMAAGPDDTGPPKLYMPGMRRVPRPLPHIVRLGPYNLSPGGPSLLYREPVRRVRRTRALERPSVRAATWLKGAEVPGAVFTQYGWVFPSAAAGSGLPGSEPTSGEQRLSQSLESLTEGALMPTLEAFCRRIGVPRETSSLHPTRSTRPSLTDSQQDMLNSIYYQPPGTTGSPALRISHFMAPHPGGNAAGGGGRLPVSPSGPTGHTPAVPSGDVAHAGLHVGHATLLPHPPGHHPPGGPRGGAGGRMPLARHSSAGAEGAGSSSGAAAAHAAGAGDSGGGSSYGARSSFQRARSHGDAYTGAGEGDLHGLAASGAHARKGTPSSGGVGAPFAAFGEGGRRGSTNGGAYGAEGLLGQSSMGGVGADLQGDPFQIALMVLRTRSIKPGVAQRVFPLGRAYVNDPASDIGVLTVAAAAAASAADAQNDPVSYPLDDLSSVGDTSSSDDGDGGWTTDKDTELGTEREALRREGREQLESMRESRRAARREQRAAAAAALHVDVDGGVAEELDDEDSVRQFDVLYDMTRWAVAPPPTPTSHRPDDDVIAITLRRSNAAKQRKEEEQLEERRARLLGPYRRMLGGAYERVLYRRRQARAMALLAAQNPVIAMLRSVAVVAQVPGRPYARQRRDEAAEAEDAAAEAVAEAAAAGKRDAAAGGFRGATVGGGFRVVHRGLGLAAAAAAAAAESGEPPGEIWTPTRGGRMQMRMRPGGGCTSGFGNSYYWRQPARLGSLMQVKPVIHVTIPVSPPASPGGSHVTAVKAGALEQPVTPKSRLSPLTAAAAVTLLPSGLPLPLPLPPPPPEVTEMAETALKILSELGSEIGRMEEQIEVLRRKAELEQRRKAAETAEPPPLLPPASAAPPSSTRDPLPPLPQHHHHHHHHRESQSQRAEPQFQQQQEALTSQQSLGHPPSYWNPHPHAHPHSHAHFQQLPTPCPSQRTSTGKAFPQLHAPPQPQTQRQVAAHAVSFSPNGTAAAPLYKTHYLKLHQHAQAQHQPSTVIRNRLAHPPQRPSTVSLDLPDGIHGVSAPRVLHPTTASLSTSRHYHEGAGSSASLRSLSGVARHPSTAASSSRRAHSPGSTYTAGGRPSGASTARSLANATSVNASGAGGGGGGGGGSGSGSIAEEASPAAGGATDAGRGGAAVQSHSSPLIRFAHSPSATVLGAAGLEQVGPAADPDGNAVGSAIVGGGQPELRPMSSFGPGRGPIVGSGGASVATGLGGPTSAEGPLPQQPSLPHQHSYKDAHTNPNHQMPSALSSPSPLTTDSQSEPGSVAPSLPSPPATASPARRQSPRPGLVPTLRVGASLGSPPVLLGPVGISGTPPSHRSSLSGGMIATEASVPGGASPGVTTNGGSWAAPRPVAATPVEVGPWEWEGQDGTQGGGKAVTTGVRTPPGTVGGRTTAQSYTRLGSPTAATSSTSALPSIISSGGPPDGGAQGPGATAAGGGGSISGTARYSIQQRAAWQGSGAARDGSGLPSPLTAWAGLSSSLPDIPNGPSPRVGTATAPGSRSSLSYATTSGASVGGGGRTPPGTAAGRLAQSPPHSPMRTYPRMELGLGSPTRLRRGSAHSPTMQYYYTSGGQNPTYDMHDTPTNVCISVDSLLLNVALLQDGTAAAVGGGGPGSGAASGATGGGGGSLGAERSPYLQGRGSSLAVRRPRTSEVPTASGSGAAAAASAATLTELGITGSGATGLPGNLPGNLSGGALHGGNSSRFAGVRRQSIGPVSGPAGPGAAAAAAP